MCGQFTVQWVESGQCSGIVDSAVQAIQHSIKKILSHKGNWLCIKVKHVNSHTGQMDSHSRGNQHADDLATAACRDNFALSPAVDHDLLG